MSEFKHGPETRAPLERQPASRVNWGCAILSGSVLMLALASWLLGVPA